MQNLIHVQPEEAEYKLSELISTFAPVISLMTFL
jgi:hypothetical protein